MMGVTVEEADEDEDDEGPAVGREDMACRLRVAYLGEVDVGESIEGSCAACRMIVTIREKPHKGCRVCTMIASKKEGWRVLDKIDAVIIRGL